MVFSMVGAGVSAVKAALVSGYYMFFRQDSPGYFHPRLWDKDREHEGEEDTGTGGRGLGSLGEEGQYGDDEGGSPALRRGTRHGRRSRERYDCLECLCGLPAALVLWSVWVVMYTCVAVSPLAGSIYFYIGPSLQLPDWPEYDAQFLAVFIVGMCVWSLALCCAGYMLASAR